MSTYSFGWKPDKREYNALTLKTSTISKMVSNKLLKNRLAVVRNGNVQATLPKSADISSKCPPIVNQGELGSCTANAGVGLVETYQNIVYGDCAVLSRLYLYRATRILEKEYPGDNGATLHGTVNALCRGVPLEATWPYDITKVDTAPYLTDKDGQIIPDGDDFLLAEALQYRVVRPVALDYDEPDVNTVLNNIKTAIASNLPVIFGTLVFEQIETVGSDGNVAYPSNGEQPIGGHALLIVGYDDDHKNMGTSNVGAFKVRNSWGTGWGMQGYCWIPYDYCLNHIAQDFWTIIGEDWIDANLFN